MEKVETYKVNQDNNIREAVKKIDEGGIGFVTIVDDNDKVVGVVTDGDFRRAVLKGIDLNESIQAITNTSYKFLQSGYSNSEVVDLFENNEINYLPVLKDGVLVDIINRSDQTSSEVVQESFTQIEAPVVVMAGGFGTRMEPFTKILPKPLVPINDRSMVEIIMDNYGLYGMKDFYLSVNYKANMIKAYFEYTQKDYNITYIHEDKPLGTGGALKYLEKELNTPFFVSNCDIIIKEDYSKIYEYHNSSDFALTMICSMQHHKIPYGVCEVNEEGELIGMKEKPEYDFLVNGGMYVISPYALEFIPENEFFNITDLIEKLMANGHKIGVYPVSEKSYVDIGQWAEYKKAVSILSI